MTTRVRRSAAPTSAVALIDLAGQIGLELPDAYRDWLLAHNGGVPDRDRFHYTSGKGKQKSGRVLWLHPAGRDGLVEMTANDLLTAFQQKPVGLPVGLLPVAAAATDMNTGSLCLMCQGPDARKVFFRPDVESTKETAHPVADSWPAFLAGLTFETGKPPKPWKQAVWDKDTAGLKAILDKGGRWKDDYGTRLDIFREVVAEGSWPLTELLLSYPEFLPADIFEDALANDRLVLAAQFLDRGLVTSVKPKTLLSSGPAVLHAPPLLRALLERGADPTAEDDGGTTPLHKAVELRAAEAVDILLAAGADPTAKDDDGRTPQKLARRLEETALAGRLAAAELAWKNRPAPAEPDLAPFDLKGITFQYPGTPLTLAEIQAFEAEQKLDLPAAYRWLLTQTNGGSPNPGLIPFDRMPLNDDEVEDEEDEEYQRSDVAVRFLPLRQKDGAPAAAAGKAAKLEDVYQLAYAVEEARGWYHDGGEIPRGTLPIGSLANYGVDDSAFLLIGLKGRDRGKILVYDYGSTKLVNSLADFFALLAECGARPKTAGERFADAIDAGDSAAAIAIIREGEPIPFDARDGRLPVRAAAQRGMDDVLFALAEQGYKLDDILTQASYAGRTALMRRLLGVGKGPGKEGIDMILWCGETFHDAELLAALDMRGVKWEKRLKGQHSCLPSAAGSGSVAGLTFLLDKGGDVNFVDHQKATLLHHAARSFRRDSDEPNGPNLPDPAAAEAMIRLLLGRGAQVNRPDEGGQTALHYAVEQGNVAAAKRLIDAGEDMHATFELVPAGMTPEQAKKQAEKMAKMASKMFGEIGKGMPDDEDAPAIDTSEPAGEKAAETMGLLAKAQHAMGGMMGALGAKMAAMAAGSWGRGPSAADGGRKRGQAAAVAELEAYQKRRVKG